MGKLIFMKGAMGSCKSSTLIQKDFQFRKCGKKVLVLRPELDTRSEASVVSSRVGLSCDAVTVSNKTDICALYKDLGGDFEIILVDESNFFTEQHIDELSDLCDYHNCFVMAFGLNSDFQGKLFPSSKRLHELADRIDELPSMCESCGKKATMHVRMIRDLTLFVCGDDIYKSVCRTCFKRFHK